MKRIKKTYIFFGVFNLTAIIAVLILNISGNSIAKSQKYNYTADKWDSNEHMDYTQISCFISEKLNFTENDVNILRTQINDEIKQYPDFSETDNKIFIDSYFSSAISGNASTMENKSTNADIMAVGGDFFYFRNFQFLSGTYFSDDEIMQDNAVIDSKAAWALFGSNDAAGMFVYVNGVKLRISGVIQMPENKYEKSSYGDTPKIYISNYGFKIINSNTISNEDIEIPQDSDSTVTCYECILPEPVKDSGCKFLKSYFDENYSDKYEIIRNTNRFSKSAISDKFKKSINITVENNEIIYPFWEIGSKIAELHLVRIYFIKKVLYFIIFVSVFIICIFLIKETLIK